MESAIQNYVNSMHPNASTKSYVLSTAKVNKNFMVRLSQKKIIKFTEYLVEAI